MRSSPFILMIPAMMLLGLAPLQAQPDLAAIDNQLDAIVTNLGNLQSDVADSYRVKKFSLSGTARFEMEYLHEAHSPLNVTNHGSFFYWQDSYSPNFALNLHYMPLNGFDMNAKVGLDFQMDGTHNIDLRPLNDFYLSSSLRTFAGNFNVQIGGPWWLSSTMLTYSALGFRFQSAPFDRNIWDGIGVDYYWIVNPETKVIEERSDGAAGIKGIRVGMSRVLGYLQGEYFIGKTENSSIYGIGDSASASYGRLETIFGGHNIIGAGFARYIENPANIPVPHFDNDNVSLYSKGSLGSSFKYSVEAGYSYARYGTNSVNSLSVIGAAGFFIKKFLFLENVPLRFNAYYIPGDYIGELSGIYPTMKKFPVGWYAVNPQPDDSAMFNNRTGGSVKARFQFLKCYIDLLWGETVNLVPTTNNVNFSHNLDHTIWWRIFDTLGRTYSPDTLDSTWGTPGVQANMNTYWNGAGENAHIIDPTSRIRYFNIVTLNFALNLSEIIPDLQRTYFAVSTYQKSIENQFTAFPSYKAGTLLWGSYYDVFLATGFIPKIYLIGYFGEEVWRSEAVNPLIVQTERSFGAGVNYEFMPQAALYFRIKRYYHFDEQRRENDFDGLWTSFEVKTYF